MSKPIDKPWVYVSIELGESSVDHWPCVGDGRGTVVWQTVAVEEPGEAGNPGVEAPMPRAASLVRLSLAPTTRRCCLTTG